eukprot:NODE_29449_length_446_cov_0.771160.p1 GENE.NODE_29449_length_446_cov_0.771160~~NODE_29449_length_446_cov_0.771160.p1  ORF type:complete len:65 (-),score=12.31 NODE_29449_length_446_cov_0.771160:175-369(-)
MYTLESIILCFFFFFKAEDGIRVHVRSRGLGDVYKKQGHGGNNAKKKKKKKKKYSALNLSLKKI